MNFQEEKARAWLQRDFAARQNKNSNFSVRAYARTMAMNSGALSQILSGKCKLSEKQAEKISQQLNLDADKKAAFLGAAPRTKGRCQGASSEEYREIRSDLFRIIADWYHYAILSLLETKAAPTTPRQIANRLDIKVNEAKDAIERLLRIGLLNKIDGRIVVDTEGLTTTHDIPSPAIRNAHLQMQEQVSKALATEPVDRRDNTFITFTLDPKALPKAKAMLKNFRRKFASSMEKNDSQRSLCSVDQLNSPD